MIRARRSDLHMVAGSLVLGTGYASYHGDSSSDFGSVVAIAGRVRQVACKAMIEEA